MQWVTVLASVLVVDLLVYWLRLCCQSFANLLSTPVMTCDHSVTDIDRHGTWDIHQTFDMKHHEKTLTFRLSQHMTIQTCDSIPQDWQWLTDCHRKNYFNLQLKNFVADTTFDKQLSHPTLLPEYANLSNWEITKLLPQEFEQVKKCWVLCFVNPWTLNTHFFSTAATVWHVVTMIAKLAQDQSQFLLSVTTGSHQQDHWTCPPATDVKCQVK